MPAMTGPPHEISHQERHSPTARMAQTAVPDLLASPPPGASSAAYQLSLAHVLPWLEGTPSSKTNKPFLLPPVPAVPPITIPHQQQHQSNAPSSGWSWDSGGGGIYQTGCLNTLTAATGVNGAAARSSHSSARKTSASGCPNASTNRQADVSTASKQRHSVNTNPSGRVVSPLAIQQLQQLTGPHHLSSFPQQSFSLAAAHKHQCPTTASVAISINGTISSTSSGGSSFCDVSNSNSASIVANVTTVSSKTYNVHLPGLIPARALRPRGSFSSCSGVGSSPGGAGGSGPSALLVSGGGAGSEPPSVTGVAVPNSSASLPGLGGSSARTASQSSWEGNKSHRHLALVVRG